MKRNKRRVPIFFLITALIVIGAVLLIRVAFLRLIATDSFTVKDILSKDDSLVEFDYLKGRSIFGIDISREATYLSRVYPQYRTIEIYKMFPNTLFIDFVKRSPIAIIKLPQGYYCIDENLVFFEAPLPLEQETLPVISGLERRWSLPVVGQKYLAPELKLAVAIIQGIRKNDVLKRITIKEIDVSQSGYVSLFSPDVPEVRFSRDFIADKIKILAGLCNQTRGEMGLIGYVDLRFQEPVLKYKNAH